MKQPSLFLCALLWAAMAGSLASRSLLFPRETATSYVELTPLKPMSLQAFTLCMRVATELSGEREVILFAYRTSYYDELNVWRELDGRLSFALSGDSAIFRLPQLGGLHTHLCLTWDSQTGASNVYLDGKRSVTKIYKKGHAVQPGGKVIVGQDPDSFLGDFDANQSLVGELTDLNLWDSALPQSTIRDLYEGRRAPRPNVLDWENLEFQVHGEVEVLDVEL